jgi:hypothetical protein
LDDVEERQAAAGQLARDRHDEAEVGPDHVVAGGVAVADQHLELGLVGRGQLALGGHGTGQQPLGVHTGLDALGQIDLFGRGEQRR